MTRYRTAEEGRIYKVSRVERVGSRGGGFEFGERDETRRDELSFLSLFLLPFTASAASLVLLFCSRLQVSTDHSTPLQLLTLTNSPRSLFSLSLAAAPLSPPSLLTYSPLNSSSNTMAKSKTSRTSSSLCYTFSLSCRTTSTLLGHASPLDSRPC